MPDGRIQTGTQVIVVPPPPLDPDLALICQATNNFYPECNPEGGTAVVPKFAQLYRKQNLNEVLTRGVETRVRLQPHRRVAFEVAYTFQNTHVSDDEIEISELPNEPPHVVDTLVSVIVPRLESTLTVQTRWRGSAVTETSGTGGYGFVSPHKSDPSVQLDLRMLQPIRGRFELYADFYNLTDTRVVDSYVVRGRSFFFGVRASLGGGDSK